MTDTMTKEHAHTALCIWEAWLEDEKSDMDTPWTGYRSAVGAVASRHACLAMAPSVDAVWEALSDDTRDDLCFDWGFVPMMLAFFHYGPGHPTLNGKPEDIAAKIDASVRGPSA